MIGRKDAKILAIYKNDNKNCLQLPSNKSNKHSLQMHGKIKINRITSYMKENGMFSPKHYGFIYGRSTVLQLIIILDTWTYEIDRGHHTCYIHGLQKGLRHGTTYKTNR